MHPFDFCVNRLPHGGASRVIRIRDGQVDLAEHPPELPVEIHLRAERPLATDLFGAIRQADWSDDP